MSVKSKKIIFYSLIIAALVAVSVGFYLYNKGPLDVKHTKGLSVKAIDLYNLYSSDSLSAGKKYTDKVLEVNGEVVEVSLNTQQQKVILLKTATSLAYVNCTLEEQVENIKISDKIIIKGICNGIGQGDPEMGIMGDVYLTRCFLIKQSQN